MAGFFAAANMTIGLVYYVRVIADLYVAAPVPASRLAGGTACGAGLALNVAGTLLSVLRPISPSHHCFTACLGTEVEG